MGKEIAPPTQCVIYRNQTTFKTRICKSQEPGSIMASEVWFAMLKTTSTVRLGRNHQKSLNLSLFKQPMAYDPYRDPYRILS